MIRHGTQGGVVVQYYINRVQSKTKNIKSFLSVSVHINHKENCTMLWRKLVFKQGEVYFLLHKRSLKATTFSSQTQQNHNEIKVSDDTT